MAPDRPCETIDRGLAHRALDRRRRVACSFGTNTEVLTSVLEVAAGGRMPQRSPIKPSLATVRRCRIRHAGGRRAAATRMRRDRARPAVRDRVPVVHAALGVLDVRHRHLAQDGRTPVVPTGTGSLRLASTCLSTFRNHSERRLDQLDHLLSRATTPIRSDHDPLHPRPRPRPRARAHPARARRPVWRASTQPELFVQSFTPHRGRRCPPTSTCVPAAAAHDDRVAQGEH